MAQRKKLGLTLSFSKQECSRGSKERLTIKVSTGVFPLAIMKFQCIVENVFYETRDLYDIAMVSGNGATFQETFSCENCGKLQAAIHSYELIDLLGLWKRKCTCKVSAWMLVMPPYVQSAQIDSFAQEGMEKEKEIARRSGFQSDDSYEIKEYQEGDSLKRLHHNMTYKLNKPMIRQYANMEQAQIMLVLDMSGEEQIVENTLTMFHSTARSFLKQGIQVRCCYGYHQQPHLVELVLLSQIRQVLADILSVPKDPSKIRSRGTDDIQYRIHGYELSKIQDKEDHYERKTSSL